MNGILLTAYIFTISEENGLSLLNLLPIFMKIIFTYSTYIVKTINLLIQSLINLFDTNIVESLFQVRHYALSIWHFKDE